ncbi:MAG: (Fe-S)-binding protein [Promethearchaeota archaeon]
MIEEIIVNIREEHISDKGKKVVPLNPSKIIDISNLTEYNQKALITALDHCIKCNTCKYSYQIFTPSCPSGEKFLWESYWASGRIRIARALLQNQLEFSDELYEPVFACTTCGSCQDSCNAAHQDQIVDIIEALRELVVKKLGAPEKHKKLENLTKSEFNPYGAKNSDNSELKRKYQLPDKADVVYFIGCTSNYRQKQIRDATISVFKKLGINFTLIDEHCCGSPLIRTGQLDLVPSLMHHNINEIKKTGAKIVVTSCSGCYKTFKRDFAKFGHNYDFQIFR